jgi:site-specific DNA-methyltransferase (adenine-specific)
MWAECLRVLKPGGHLLAFSGTRTYHRMASAIEDAGFEVRDMIEWVYGSGFPKSLNIGKAVDKLQGNKREISGYEERFGREGRKANCGFKEEYVGASGTQDQSAMKPIMLPVSEEAKQWEGWGTALKPAHEPICMARKPLAEKTVAENCLKYRTGGINIDESRVEGKLEGDPNRFAKTDGGSFNKFSYAEPIVRNEGRFPANLIHDNSDEVKECFPESKSQGHWSKTKTTGFGEFGNGSSEYLGVGEKDKEGGNASRFFKSIKQPYTYKGKEYEVEGFVKSCKPQAPSNYNDEGSPARYFKSIIYTAKASKSERNKGCEELEEKEYTMSSTPKRQFIDGVQQAVDFTTKPLSNKNNHPTVKPIALMEYLIKMVTPKGGVVLDPFAGSGSTLVAAKENGFNYIGIELTEEYIPIIEARLKDINYKLL